MAEINTLRALETMMAAGLISPHPAGVITKQFKSVKIKFTPWHRSVPCWRLWLGDNDYRDFDTEMEAEGARVLRSLLKR